MAVAQYTEVSFTPQSPGESIKTAFENLSSGEIYPLKLLGNLKKTLDDRFDMFKKGDLEVHKILSRPDDLAVYTLASLLIEGQKANTSSLPGLGGYKNLPYPGKLSSKSDIKIGSGFGSSAAVVAATTILFEHLLNRHKSLEERYERVRFCERLKHGKSGPIDAATVVHGGLIKCDEHGPRSLQYAQNCSLSDTHYWYWALLGVPESSTGECVEHVRRHHGKDAGLWDGFMQCTNAFTEAISSGLDPKKAIEENSHLLSHIGVVPQSAQDFFTHIKKFGGVGKICGAGTIAGEGAGAVLIYNEDPDAMRASMQDYPNIRWDSLKMANSGASIGFAPKASL